MPRLPDLLRASTARVQSNSSHFAKNGAGSGAAGAQIRCDSAREEVMEAHEKEWLFCTAGLPAWSLIAGSDGQIVCVDTVVPGRSFVVFGRQESGRRKSFTKVRQKHLLLRPMPPLPITKQQSTPGWHDDSCASGSIECSYDVVVHEDSTASPRPGSDAGSGGLDTAGMAERTAVGVSCMAWAIIPEQVLLVGGTDGTIQVLR